MFEVRFPKDIRQYKEKVLGGLTLRQLVCGGLGLLIAVPAYIFGRKYVPEDIIALVAMVIGGGMFFVGFGTLDGMTAEKYIWNFFVTNIKKPRKRHFARKSFETDLEEQAEAILKRIRENEEKIRKL